MRTLTRRFTMSVTLAVFATCLGAGVIAAAPVPFSGVPVVDYNDIVNSGKVARVTTTGTTVTITATALDRSQCVTGIALGTPAQVIADQAIPGGVQTTGPQDFLIYTAPDAVDLVGNTGTVGQVSPVTLTRTLAPGEYTVASQCVIFTGVGVFTRSNDVYLEGVTVTATPAPAFGSS